MLKRFWQRFFAINEPDLSFYRGGAYTPYASEQRAVRIPPQGGDGVPSFPGSGVPPLEYTCCVATLPVFHGSLLHRLRCGHGVCRKCGICSKCGGEF